MIVHDARNPIAATHRARLEDQLNGFDDPELILVIGGDGFMLQTIHELGMEHTYLGLNAGRVGFLLNDVQDWAAVAHHIRSRAWSVTEFPILRATCTFENGESTQVSAVNDVYLERASGQTARLGLTVDGSRVVDTLVADGIVVSTALGSTAYNFSAGGPPCHPILDILTVTPICPHLPRLSPFALPAGTQIEVAAQNTRFRPVRAVADGRQIGEVTHVVLELGRRELKMAHLPEHNFTAQMVQKILHP